MRKEVIGDAVLYLADARDVLQSLDFDALVTDTPYGVELGSHAGAAEKRAGHLVKQGYDVYEDTLENFQRVIAPVVIEALDIAARGLVFCSEKGAWFLPPPSAIGGVYMPAACGRSAWGYQSLAHAFLYGSAPDLHKGAKAIVLRSSEAAEKNGHPCPKPLGWMEWAVDLASRPGETICDPFMGSGTTEVACVMHWRKFVGVELSPSYFDIACRRIEQAYKQRPLFQPEHLRHEQFTIDVE